MHVLQCYQIPLTITTFVNCYRRLSSWRLNNQTFCLSDRIAMPMLAVGVTSFWICCDAGLLILNGRTLSDESREFTCLANGGRNIVDYIVG
jgi:hypothetical protein